MTLSMPTLLAIQLVISQHLLLSPSKQYSNKRLLEASSVLYFSDHHTPIQIVPKHTETLNTAQVYQTWVSLITGLLITGLDWTGLES